MVHAQFSGGTGSAFWSPPLIQTNCSAQTEGAIYHGGITDGFSHNLLNRSNCSIQTPEMICHGGIADGYSSTLLTQTNCAIQTPDYVYSGGANDGNGWNIFQQTSCTASHVLKGILSNWQGRCDGNEKVVLNWTTESEINNNYFEIERSADGLNWLAVGNVKATGKYKQLKNYTFNHYGFLNGNSFYRLKQVYNDGSNDYSATVNVSCDNGKGLNISVYPNPTKGIFSISGFGEKADLSVYDQIGQKLLQKSISDDYEEINMGNIINGIYHIIVNSENKIISKKLVITR